MQCHHTWLCLVSIHFWCPVSGLNVFMCWCERDCNRTWKKLLTLGENQPSETGISFQLHGTGRSIHSAECQLVVPLISTNWILLWCRNNNNNNNNRKELLRCVSGLLTDKQCLFAHSHSSGTSFYNQLEGWDARCGGFLSRFQPFYCEILHSQSTVTN